MYRASPPDEELAQAHARLLKDQSLQFDRGSFTPPEVPAWLRWIPDALDAIAPLLKWAFWIGLILLAGLILFAIGREIVRLRRPPSRPKKPKALVAEEWRPDAQAAKDLLADADALAARGLYAEAAHILLLRSVQDIEKRQPNAVRVSLTTREIMALKALPDTARPAFSKIGRTVEHSLFGGAPVDSDAFAECRQAYEAFALPDAWAR
ncbi:MAG: hypothetical protein ACK4FB_04455 [Brevundimonas sp.]|uniref:hypothetical protein n=1 Tax=Brevundimonas sp. TaxID=1871086 RepID=UPI0039196D3E